MPLLINSLYNTVYKTVDLIQMKSTAYFVILSMTD